MLGKFDKFSMVTVAGLVHMKWRLAGPVSHRLTLHCSASETPVMHVHRPLLLYRGTLIEAGNCSDSANAINS